MLRRNVVMLGAVRSTRNPGVLHYGYEFRGKAQTLCHRKLDMFEFVTDHDGIDCAKCVPYHDVVAETVSARRMFLR